MRNILVKTMLLGLAGLTASPALAQQKTVCTVTINSSDEVQDFRKNLSPRDFKFVELTNFDAANATGPNRATSQWFKNACDAGIKCDVLIMSAHFGGMFFGQSGFQLPITPLEKNSCASTCDGILKNPKEVFLFGCNTLADKGKDTRTQAQYVQVLINDGYDPIQAARVAETRYGAIGSSFVDQMRRNFEGVPHIYGFDSIAPSGAHIKPLLDRYFQMVPDYSKHLDDSAAPVKNQALAAALKSTSMVEIVGVGATPGDAGLSYRQQICSTYDEKTSLAARMQVIESMLTGTDKLIFLRTAANFLESHLSAVQHDPASAATLNEISSNQSLLYQLDTMVNDKTTSAATKLDLMNINMLLGRTTRAQFEQSVLSTLHPLLKTLRSDEADFLCSSLRAFNLKMNVRYEDFTAATLMSAPVLTAFQCLSTDDQRITAAIGPLIYQRAIISDEGYLNDYIKSMIRLPGYNDVKVKIAKQIGDPDMAPWAVGLMLSADVPAAQMQDAARLAQFANIQSEFTYVALGKIGERPGLGEAILQNLTPEQGSQVYGVQLYAVIHSLPYASPLWSQIGPLLTNAQGAYAQGMIGELNTLPNIPPAVVDYVVSLVSPNHRTYMSLIALLQRAPLTPAQYDSLAKFVDGFTGQASDLANWILSTNSTTQAAWARHKKTHPNGPASVSCFTQNQGQVCTASFQ